MIQYALICGQEHTFTGWFKNAETFDKQAEEARVSCPTCGDKQISKTLQTPHIGNNAGRNRSADSKAPEPSAVSKPAAAPAPAALPAPTPVPPSPKDVANAAKLMTPEAAEAFQKLYAAAIEIRKTVEKNCDDVGKDFAEEARKIHYGEADARGIYGQVSKTDAEDLIEEGISIAPLPDLPKTDS